MNMMDNKVRKNRGKIMSTYNSKNNLIYKKNLREII